MQIMWSRSTETYSYYGFFYVSYDIQGTKQRSNNNNQNTLYLGKNKTYDINRKLQTNAHFPFEMLFSILQVIFFLFFFSSLLIHGSSFRNWLSSKEIYLYIHIYIILLIGINVFCFFSFQWMLWGFYEMVFSVFYTWNVWTRFIHTTYIIRKKLIWKKNMF